MPRSFDLSAESPSSVDDFHSAFRNEGYWRDRVAAMGNATLDSLTVDTDGRVDVDTTFRLLSDGLPTVVTRLRRGELTLVHGETWNRIGDDALTGRVDVTMSGVPLSVVGTGSLAPHPEGTRLSYTATVEVKVPVVGGAVEKFIGGQLTNWLHEVERFTTAWIARHGNQENGGLT